MKEKLDSSKAVGGSAPSTTDTEDVSGFWSGIREGKLRIRQCVDCAETHYYPRSVCPFCGSEALEWLDCVGTGTIYSFSTTYQKSQDAFTVAYVSLPEGVAMLSRVIQSNLAELKIGDHVRISFQQWNDQSSLPCFINDDGLKASGSA